MPNPFPIVLSVCMIVKNEESNLPRCLDSLKPVMANIPTEIIIVDTGSTDRTVEIARQYTENVYYHEWNNNFSDMRNISISYAQGEWIFIFDADEELEDPEGLVKVFTSFEQLDKVKTIRLHAKNILSKATNKAVYHMTERLFRNDGEFRYAGSVHNQAQYKQPVLNTDVILIHYGYDNDNPELMEKKFKRTSALLHKELEKSPENIYFLWQLARTYFMNQDLLGAESYMEQAYQLVLDKIEPANLSTFYYIYGDYARILYTNEKYEQCISLTSEIISVMPTYIDAHMFNGIALQQLNREDEAVQSFESFFSLYVQYLNNKLDMKQFAHVEIHSVDSRFVTPAASYVVKYYRKKENYQRALEINRFMVECREKLQDAIQILIQMNRFESIGTLYESVKAKTLLPAFIECLEAELRALSREQAEAISRSFRDDGDTYSQFHALRASGSTTTIKQFLRDQLNDDLPVAPYYQSVIMALRAGLSVDAYLKKLSDSRIKQWIKMVIDDCTESRTRLVNGSLQTKPRLSDVHSTRLHVAIANVLLLTSVEEAKSKNMLPADDAIALFEHFTRSISAYITLLYQKTNLRLVYPTLDNTEHKFYILIHLASEALESGHTLNALQYYREASEAYPFLAEYLMIKIADLQSDWRRVELIEVMERDVPPADTECRVLHGTIEIANQMSLLTQALNKQPGMHARSLTYHPNYLKYQADYTFDATMHPLLKRTEKDMEIINRHALERFDLFHFHFGTSMYLDNMDLQLLKEAGKGVLMHYWGSEVRMLSIARKHNPFVKTRIVDEDEVKRKLERLGSFIDHCVVADHELYQYVKGYHNHTHFIKQSIDIDLYKPAADFKFRKKKPVVVHAPTSPELKGTAYILHAIQQLKKEYDFEFIKVQQLSHEEAKKIYQKADIVLDELLIGSYGILAMEAMAMGKPVITYLNEHIRETYPADLPIVSANPHTVKEALVPLLKDWELRQELGKQGRAYVQKHHDVNEIARQFTELYRKIIPLRETTVHAN